MSRPNPHHLNLTDRKKGKKVEDLNYFIGEFLHGATPGLEQSILRGNAMESNA